MDPGHDSGSWSLQATDAELRLAHTAEHIAAVEAGYDPEAEPPIGDIYYSAGTAAAARTAAGSTIAVSLTAPDQLVDRTRWSCYSPGQLAGSQAAASSPSTVGPHT